MKPAWPLFALLLLSGLDCTAQSTSSLGGAWTVTAENDAPTGITMVLKKALVERGLGAELSHHLRRAA